MDAMNEEMLVLESEKNESEMKLRTMLQQQIKLIEYLQSENESLNCKKKKTLADRIFGRDKSKEHYFSSESPTKASTVRF